MDINKRIDSLKSPFMRKAAKLSVFYFACGAMLTIELAIAVKNGLIGFGEGFSDTYESPFSYTPDIFSGKLKQSVLKKMLCED